MLLQGGDSIGMSEQKEYTEQGSETVWDWQGNQAAGQVEQLIVMAASGAMSLCAGRPGLLSGLGGSPVCGRMSATQDSASSEQSGACEPE
jgi:hypothetical protein